MMDTDELERLANASLATWESDTDRWFDLDTCQGFGDPEDAAYVAAASPETVLALIARVRELEDLRARGWRQSSIATHLGISERTVSALQNTKPSRTFTLPVVVRCGTWCWWHSQ